MKAWHWLSEVQSSGYQRPCCLGCSSKRRVPQTWAASGGVFSFVSTRWGWSLALACNPLRSKLSPTLFGFPCSSGNPHLPTCNPLNIRTDLLQATVPEWTGHQIPVLSFRFGKSAMFRQPARPWFAREATFATGGFRFRFPPVSISEHWPVDSSRLNRSLIPLQGPSSDGGVAFVLVLCRSHRGCDANYNPIGRLLAILPTTSAGFPKLENGVRSCHSVRTFKRQAVFDVAA